MKVYIVLGHEGMILDCFAGVAATLEKALAIGKDWINAHLNYYDAFESQTLYIEDGDFWAIAPDGTVYQPDLILETETLEI